MNKKVYLKPRTRETELKNQVQLMAGSMVVQGNGLDSGESLDYGDGDKKEGNAWTDAW